jgi:hypothetical protein
VLLNLPFWSDIHLPALYRMLPVAPDETGINKLCMRFIYITSRIYIFINSPLKKYFMQMISFGEEICINFAKVKIIFGT